ncbi:acyltransferase family protein [bacterium]|nr:acyltransferase family protein [bacterium]
MQHRKQLDGLRCLAFLLVFIHHIGGFPPSFGILGVNLFFALSGFLITRILILSDSDKLFENVRTFYIRRFLRIFPVYYITLTFLFSMGWLPHPIWHFTYLWNLKIFLMGNSVSLVNHFWSLCIEEQFYILYAPILLMVKDSRRLALVTGLLLATIVIGAACWILIPGKLFQFLLPVRGQYLLWGCLAGLLDLRWKDRQIPASAIFLTGTALNCLFIWMYNNNIRSLGVDDIICGSASALAALGLWRSKNKILHTIFANTPAVYLGKISYGLYLFHLFSIPVFEVFANLFPLFQGLERKSAYLATTILMATISWYGLERPMNSLKDRFAYKLH